MRSTDEISIRNIHSMTALAFAQQATKVDSLILGTFDYPETNVGSPEAYMTVLGSGLSGSKIYVAGIPATVIFDSPGQVNFRVPEILGPMKTTVRVLTPEALNVEVPIELRATSPGLFQWCQRCGPKDADGKQTCAFDGIVTHADYNLVTEDSRAKAGETLIAWGTGFGSHHGGSSGGYAGQFYDAAIAVTFTGAGGIPLPAKVVWPGQSPQFAGVAQLMFVVPDAAPSGEVPFKYTAGTVERAATVWVQ